MARIAGVDLPRDKRIEIGLTYVYGIGRTSAKRILEETGINPDTRVRDLTDEEEARIRECIDKDQSELDELVIREHLVRYLEIECEYQRGKECQEQQLAVDGLPSCDIPYEYIDHISCSDYQGESRDRHEVARYPGSRSVLYHKTGHMLHLYDIRSVPCEKPCLDKC